jgi:hypothetical protein
MLPLDPQAFTFGLHPDQLADHYSPQSLSGAASGTGGHKDKGVK